MKKGYERILDQVKSPFYKMTRRARIERLRRVALSILIAYNIEPRRLKFISSTNAVFRVEDRAGQCYILKFDLKIDPVHDHGFNNVEPWTSISGTDLYLQTHWQDALAHNTNLCLQKPVRTRDGRLIATARVEGLSDPVECTLCTWIFGRILVQQWTQLRAGIELTIKAGRLAATLHNHAQQWDLPRGCRRPRQGWQDTAQMVCEFGLGYPASREALTSKQRRVLEQAVDQILSVFGQLGTDRAHYGLIHEDLWRQNLILHRGQLVPIDFGNTVFGYYLWDIVHTYGLTAFNTPEYGSRYRAYFAGYQEVRPLPDNYQHIVQTLLTYWSISLIYDCIVETPDAPEIIRKYAIPRALQFAEFFVAGQPFPRI